jgi:hypothetical protein
MQISFSTTDHRAELKALTLMLASLCGMTVIDKAAAGDFTSEPAPTPLPTLPPADNPATGLDTAAVFGGKPATLAEPQAPLPAAVVTSPSTQGGAIELDAEGLPWDERIHSSNHKRGDDGVWMQRRGTGNQKVMVERVKAELRATLPQAMPVPTNPSPLFPQAQAAAPTPAALPPLAPLPAPAAPVTAPVAPISTALPAPTNLTELMQQVAPLMQAGKVTADTLTAACMMQGVAGLPMLATATPETVCKVWEALPK